MILEYNIEICTKSDEIIFVITSVPDIPLIETKAHYSFGWGSLTAVHTTVIIISYYIAILIVRSRFILSMLVLDFTI